MDDYFSYYISRKIENLDITKEPNFYVDYDEQYNRNIELLKIMNKLLTNILKNKLVTYDITSYTKIFNNEYTAFKDKYTTLLLIINYESNYSKYSDYNLDNVQVNYLNKYLKHLKKEYFVEQFNNSDFDYSLFKYALKEYYSKRKENNIIYEEPKKSMTIIYINVLIVMAILAGIFIYFN